MYLITNNPVHLERILDRNNKEIFDIKRFRKVEEMPDRLKKNYKKQKIQEISQKLVENFSNKMSTKSVKRVSQFVLKINSMKSLKSETKINLKLNSPFNLSDQLSKTNKNIFFLKRTNMIYNYNQILNLIKKSQKPKEDFKLSFLYVDSVISKKKMIDQELLNIIFYLENITPLHSELFEKFPFNLFVNNLKENIQSDFKWIKCDNLNKIHFLKTFQKIIQKNSFAKLVLRIINFYIKFNIQSQINKNISEDFEKEYNFLQVSISKFISFFEVL